MFCESVRGGYLIEKWTGIMPTTQTNEVNYIQSATNITVIGAQAYNKANSRWENLPIMTTNTVNLGHIESFSNAIRTYIDSSNGVTHYGGQQVIVYYIDGT